jgi:hypothetical protein
MIILSFMNLNLVFHVISRDMKSFIDPNPPECLDISSDSLSELKKIEF